MATLIIPRRTEEDFVYSVNRIAFPGGNVK
jgi:hypothetical protein